MHIEGVNSNEKERQEYEKMIGHKMGGMFVRINPHTSSGIDTVKTGNRIRNLCRERGVTVRQVQQKIGVGAQSVYAWFAGKTLPNLDHIYELSKMLDVSMDEMIVGKEPEADFFIKPEKTEEKRSGIIVLKYLAMEVLK